MADGTATLNDSATLRKQVLRGGSFLLIRQGLGIAVGAVAVLFLARLLGPRDYGLYTGAISIVGFVQVTGRLGIDAFLIRSKETPREEAYYQAFTLLVIMGTVLAVLAYASLPLLAHLLNGASFSITVAWLLPTVPVTIVCPVAVAKLERDFNFRAIGQVELCCQLLYYVVSLLLLLVGLGLWAPIIGYWMWQLCASAAMYRAAQLRPHFCWSPEPIREMLSYGITYSLSTWVWQVKSLVNPLVVGHFMGAEGVGYVSLIMTLTTTLSFLKDAAYRVSLVALAKVQDDVVALRSGVREALALQIVLVGVPLGGFAIVGSWLLPGLFGDRWGPALVIYPLVAVGSLANALFSMHSSVLYVMRRNLRVAAFNFVYILLLTLVCLVTVPHIGLMGYGVAEVGAIASYGIIHTQVTRLLPVDYSHALPWLVGLGMPVFGPWLPLQWRALLCVPLILLFAWPGNRRQVREYFGYLTGALPFLARLLQRRRYAVAAEETGSVAPSNP